MKHDRNDGRSEMFFKNLASSYAEKSGNDLKKENAEFSVNTPPLDGLDKKLKSRIRAAKIKKWTARVLPLTACFIILVTYITIVAINIRLPIFDFSDSPDSANSPNNAADLNSNAASEMLTYEFISTKLPSGYILEKVDYDNQKAIYYIVGNNETEIILTVEEFYGNIDTEGLETININNQKAYGISKEDFSFIQYKKDNYLYMLTSPRDYDDLIKLSENLI